MWRLMLLLGCVMPGAFADIWEFSDLPVPQKQTLDVWYIFHVDATALGPQVNGGASVTFQHFNIEQSDTKVGGIEDYKKGLQVLLIPTLYRDVFKGTQLCNPSSLFPHPFPMFNIGVFQEATFPISATGSYFLSVLNCGNLAGATFTQGEVIVKQPHGYLPANKISTLSWMKCFTVINAFLLIMWALAAACHHNTVMCVQKGIAACAMMALIEAGFSYLQYEEWNRTGSDNLLLLSVSMFAYSLKCLLTLRTLLKTDVSSGLETRVALKFDAVGFVFLVAQWVWKVIIAYKYRLMMNSTFLLVATIPGTLLWLVLFCWVYRALNVWGTELQLALLGLILLATLVVLVQLADITLWDTPWNLQCVPHHAAPDSVYTLFLLAMMILWWPNGNSQNSGHLKIVSQDENEFREEGQVHAEQIGAAEAEES